MKRRRIRTSMRGVPYVHSRELGGAILQQVSRNRKLSPVAMVANSTPRLRPIPQGPFISSTYVSIEKTCPSTCPFKEGGCYVTAGFTARLGRRLDSAARRKRHASDVIVAEAMLIYRAFGGRRVPQDGACGGRDLRLHVGGDVPDEISARVLARACEDWEARGGHRPFTFTHRWREIPREAWGSINVLASVETVEDAIEARDRGYAPAITLSAFPSEKAFVLHGEVGGAVRAVKVVPCPAETRGTNCVTCRMCIDRDLNAMGVAIGFAVHGMGANKVKRRLPVLREAPVETAEATEKAVA